MKKIIHRHKIFWSQRNLRLSALAALLLLALSFLFNFFANVYVARSTGNYVSDLILDHLPVVNVDFIFSEGFTIFCLFIILLLLHQPNKIPFAVKSIALFILIRSVFITLTHLAIPPDHSYLEPNRILDNMTSSDDLFFSAHTGLPFLLALIFWENKSLKIFFISASLFFAVSVLLGHLHYSIDVFAAFFITYTIFHIAQKIFPKDYLSSGSTPAE